MLVKKGKQTHLVNEEGKTNSYATEPIYLRIYKIETILWEILKHLI